MEDALQLYGHDTKLELLFKQAIAYDALSLETEEDVLAERAMAALIDTAKTTLKRSSVDSLRWHVDVNEEMQQKYLVAVAELLDFLERERGREKVGVVSVSDDKSWVVARWVFLRLFEDALRLHGQSRDFVYVMNMALSQRGLHFHGWRDDLAEAVRAAIIQTARMTLDPSSQDLLRWHVGLDESSQQTYTEAVANLLDLLDRDEIGKVNAVPIAVDRRRLRKDLHLLKGLMRFGRKGGIRRHPKRDADDPPQVECGVPLVHRPSAVARTGKPRTATNWHNRRTVRGLSCCVLKTPPSRIACAMDRRHT